MSYCLSNTFGEAIVALDSDSSDGSGKSVENLLERIYHSRAVENICDSWEVVKISTFTGVGKKLIPTLMDGFEGIKTSEGKVTVHVVGIARELD